VVHDLFDNPIMDLSWSTQPGPALLACSMDGTVAYIQFDYKEVGHPLAKQEMVSVYLFRIYFAILQLIFSSLSLELWKEEFFMNKYNYDVNASVSLRPSMLNVPASQQVQKENKENAKFIENFDILLAQENNRQSEKENQQQNENSQVSKNNVNNNHEDSMRSLTNTPSKQAALTEVFLLFILLFERLVFTSKAVFKCVFENYRIKSKLNAACQMVVDV
jgi:hypothetical protein